MTLQEMLNESATTGKVEWIGIRPGKREAMQSVQTAHISTDKGLHGDHYQGSNKKRQLTLIQAEHLEAAAHILKRPTIDPGLTRRNVVISGINLQALKEQQFCIGSEVILETTGPCHPCSRMEENLGQGGYHAMIGHGGITTRVIQGGSIQLGDQVQMISKKQLIQEP